MQPGLVDRRSVRQMKIIVVGGGVAGLEALLALHALAGDRVDLELVAPDPDFSFRPMAVAEPFALGSAHRVPLSTVAEETGAELVQAAAVAVDDAAGRLAPRRWRDALVRRSDRGARSTRRERHRAGEFRSPGQEGLRNWRASSYRACFRLHIAQWGAGS